MAFAQGTAQADDEQERFFENSVRPLLAEHCVGCHGDKEQSGGLRLDSRDALMTGGDNGPVISVGEPQASRLVQAIRYEGDLEMPPDEQLTGPQIAVLTEWVRQGAYWPETEGRIRPTVNADARSHWAFQPVQDVLPPTPTDPSWIRTPVDAFVLAKLAANELAPSPEADRRTLIRRLSYTLTGLPPTPAQVERFVNDPDPEAYERLVDQLLDSPHYGEHWARHWLDVARYADTKGYVYAREERFWVHAWAYRDWVVRAFNEDMPYNRFLLLQIAADQVEDRRLSDLAAMGFLTLGRRFLGVERDIIDDRIDVVTRGTLGLSVGCARCHDHKYDPIPTADYYSLYGVFDSCREEVVRLDTQASADAEYEAELQKRQQALEDALVAARKEWSELIRSRVGDYLKAQTEREKYPPKGFDQIFSKTDMLPAFVERWESYLHDAERRNDPVFIPWHAFKKLPTETFADDAVAVTEQLQAEADALNPQVAALFATSPATFDEVIDRYAGLFADVDAQWKALVKAAEEAKTDPPTQLPDAASEALRHVLYGLEAPCEVPHESIVHIESYCDSGTCTNLWKLQGEVDRWIINGKESIPYAVTLVDRPTPSQPQIFVRGNPARRGDDVPRHFLSLLSRPDVEPFAVGSGRRELADAIIEPSNPLTARVMVNRVWAQHFGTGLVTTPSDFGTRADPPSHPELLDWLASRFIESDWSIKSLQRMILNSATFRQSSIGPTDPQVLARAEQADPDNRLLWRMNPRRLSFEEFRDSLLAAGGDLDLTLGGKPADLFKSPYPVRRTLYGLVDRQFFPNTLRAFDFANPDLHIPQRPETTVPQQALFVMNHPLVLERARALAKAVPTDASAQEQVMEMFERTLQRQPTETELVKAVTFLQQSMASESPVQSLTVNDWQYGYGTYDEAAERVPSFTPLPHFTGDAWQGGDDWPDAQLGWVQLTATGGHPGNDRDHASVRRWIAPRNMSIRIRSTLVHDASPGDGIRAFIVSSRAGLIASATAHQQTRELDCDLLQVAAGETIDFVVDIGDVLNSDQHLWKATISETSAGDTPLTWNSEADFTHDVTAQLTPREQLAQVLLSANEFLFID